MGKYQLILCLRRLAAIQIIKILLRKSSFNLHLKRATDIPFIGCSNSRGPEKTPPDWVPMEQVHAFISSKIDAFVLPEMLKDELRFVAVSMENHIYTWFQLLRFREHSFVAYQYDKHIEHIHWTSLGTVDQTETARSMYKSKTLSEFYDHFKNRTRSYNPFDKLSYYCAEDCIKDYYSKDIVNGVSVDHGNQPFFVHVREMRLSFGSILGCYWDYHFKNREEEIIPRFEFSERPFSYEYDESYSLNENLFIMSVLAGHYWALRYFWNLLDDDQKSRTMAKMAANRKYQKCIEIHWTCKDVEVIVFLLQKLSFYGLNDLLIIMLRSHIVILKLLEWPWYSIFIEVLEDTWKYHPNFDHTHIISRILCTAKDVQKIPNSCMDYRIIFDHIWNTNPCNMKRTLDYGVIFKQAVEHKAVSELSWIINADELKERRPELLNCALQAFKNSSENLNALQEFINVVLITDCEKERELFKSEVIAKYKDRRIRC